MRKKQPFSAVIIGFLLGTVTFLSVGRIVAWAEEKKADLLFDIVDTGEAKDAGTPILAWKTVALDPDYSGDWVVTGDVDGDGQVDIVSARNVNQDDVHYTSAVSAQRLDGSVLWRWGDPKIGRKNLHHDVACQIYASDGDGRNEIIVLGDKQLMELDGATGKEKRRLPIPPEASDSLVFANLSGGPRATDFLVKTRYTQIWAYNREGKLLWTAHEPGGYRTSHQARPIDLDGDGVDEIAAGYAMLNHDGTVRWVFQSKQVDLARGHLDAIRVLRPGKTPKDARLALTCCGANNIALIDGEGHPLWEISGHHFESIQIGDAFPDLPGVNILVDIDHQLQGKSPLWIVSENGERLGQIVTDYSRHHEWIDWTGDGACEIVNACNHALYDTVGKRIATFSFDGPGGYILLGDMTGDSVGDITITAPDKVYIFKNEKKNPTDSSRLGCGVNFTLY